MNRLSWRVSPETKLWAFTDQYTGLSVKDRIKVGGNKNEGYVAVDGLSGATVTVMVMNVAVTKAATKVAQALGIVKKQQSIIQPPSTILQDQFEKADWLQLTGDGSIRKLYLTNEKIDEAFVGTDAEHIDNAPADEKQDMFAEIYFALADVPPTIGRNLFGDADYEWLTSSLQPGEHLVAVLGNGYSFKGSGYVRGGIFDRIQIHQVRTQFRFAISTTIVLPISISMAHRHSKKCLSSRYRLTMNLIRVPVGS